MPSPIVDKIRSVLSAPIAAVGYELLEIEWKREPGGWVCRLFVDKPDGAMSLDDCTKVSHDIGPVLDAADVIPQQYNLEVSSPGLDRPLRTTAHFARYVGEKAKVRLVSGVDGRRNFSGTIVSVPADSPARVVVNVDGKEYTLPLADLERANLVYEFDRKRE